MGAMSVVVTKAVASKIAIAVGEAQGRGKLLKNHCDQESRMHNGVLHTSSSKSGRVKSRNSLVGNCSWRAMRSSCTAHPMRDSIRKARHEVRCVNALVGKTRHSSSLFNSISTLRKQASSLVLLAASVSL
jgi:hypothetical protein